MAVEIFLNHSLFIRPKLRQKIMGMKTIDFLSWLICVSHYDSLLINKTNKKILLLKQKDFSTKNKHFQFVSAYRLSTDWYILGEKCHPFQTWLYNLSFVLMLKKGIKQHHACF